MLLLAILGAISAIVSVIRNIPDIKDRWLPKEAKENRKVLVGEILKEIQNERGHLERIKDDYHLGLIGTKRKAILEYSFDDIKRETQKLLKEFKYRKLANKIIDVIDKRNIDDPKTDIAILEPLLDTFEKKLERELKN